MDTIVALYIKTSQSMNKILTQNNKFKILTLSHSWKWKANSS